MFQPTSNPYKFRYLQTGISGPGIPCVFLPPVPTDNQILFKKEQKFVRTVIPNQLQAWMEEFEQGREKNEEFVHPHQIELNLWEETEFERCENGIWFWNDGVRTYLTGDNYKFLTQWEPLFGFPDYWETDRELFYWIKFWEQDPKSYGGLYNTGRRKGKSTKMGFWIMNRTSSNFKHLSGMQGEDNVKIKDFYEQMVIEPFYKLPYYSKPIYDTTTLQKKGIIFKDPPRRNKKIVRSKKKIVLESRMDYRTSEANKYDQAKLHSSVVEEPGKCLACDIGARWGYMKPCHLDTDGITIIGKHFAGTTVEFMDTTDKGGRAYKKLCYRSDYDKRTGNGETASGLYAALMPADCVGLVDTHGRPRREESLRNILAAREVERNNPKEYSTLIRKFPLNWNEVFYINTEKCEFNAMILQDRKSDLQMNPIPMRRVDLNWAGGKRFSSIVISDNAANGWLLFSSFVGKEFYNAVGDRIEGGKKFYYPKNDHIFRLGGDPIDHGIVVDNAKGGDEFVNARRSRPVLIAKRMYDSSIDGLLSQDLLEQRAREHYRYKTGIDFLLMDTRPNDPNVFFERGLMICWLLGCKAHMETQNPGFVNWFKNNNCTDFLWQKYVPDGPIKKSDMIEGTPASPMIIQEGTSAIATDVEYFGHTYPFIEVIEDLLMYDPANRREHDYSVAKANLELACRMRPLREKPEVVDISHYMPTYDRNGNILHRRVENLHKN